MITFTGGKPLLRRDLEDVVASVAHAVRLKYATLITHGGMLTPERGKSLWDAGAVPLRYAHDPRESNRDGAPLSGFPE